MGFRRTVREHVLQRLVALKIIGTIAAGCALLSLAPAAAWGQTEDGQINITVTDATTKAPLALARVLLDGPVMSSELTTSTGRVIFRDAPAGVYTARIAKAGYQSVTTSSFEVIAGRAVDVSAALAPTSNIKTLGIVVVKSSASVSGSNLSQDSAIRKLSPTLNDALNKLAGVSVATDSTGNDAAETISLSGHDPSQTQVMLDGIPLNSPGGAGDLRLISSDLFGGASVSFNPVAGALGGSVNYRTLEPTRTWQEGLTQSFGNLSALSTIFSIQGTAGDIGLAYVHAIRGSNNQLDGSKYLDTSGFDYAHQGANQTGGDLVKLRTLLGQTQSLSAMFLSSNGYNDALCTLDTGVLPCGFGPGNSNYRHLSLESLSDTALIGLTSVQLSLFGSQVRFDRNLLNRFVDGVYTPFGSQTTGNTRGASLNAQLPSRERHTISFQATTSSSQSQSSALVPSASVFAAGSGTSSYSSFSVADSVRSNDRLTLGERLGVSNANHAGTSLLAGISANWNPNAADAFNGSLDFGNNGAGPARFGVLTDPASLQFDCSGQAGYGSGPGDSPGAQKALSERVTWQHRWLGIGQLSTSLYRQVQNDALINALVNGSAFPPGYFPPGYFGTAEQVFQSAGGCGLPTTSFGASNLYLSVPVSGVKMVYEGMQLSGTFNVSRNLAAEPFYATQVAKPISDDPRLANAFSPVISGSQLPGVPLHQAGLTLDYRAPRSAVEWLADGRYVSGNNRQNLPGYVTADAGVGIDFTYGTLTVSESNIFNKFGYDFASSSYAVGPPTVDAGLLPAIARPLAPRQLTVTYSVKVGLGQGQAQPLPAAANVRGGGPPGEGGPPGRGPGFFTSLPGYPQAPPTDPFAAETKRPSCNAQAAGTATQTLVAMKVYVAAVEAAKTPSGYAATLPAQMPDVPGFTVAYHPLQSTYALTFSPQTFGSLRGFMGCAPLHVGTKEQAQSLHLYIPQASSFFRNPLAFTPAAGLYIVRQPQVPGQEQFRVYRLPSSPPKQPLELVQSDRCTSDLRSAAAQLLGSLAQYVSAKDAGTTTLPQPTGWSVTPHATAKSYWLELQPQPAIAIPALLNCSKIGAGSEQDITATGLGGARLPSLNYAPALGLYILRPARPPGQ